MSATVRLAAKHAPDIDALHAISAVQHAVMDELPGITAAVREMNRANEELSRAIEGITGRPQLAEAVLDLAGGIQQLRAALGRWGERQRPMRQLLDALARRLYRAPAVEVPAPHDGELAVDYVRRLERGIRVIREEVS